jgi:hypothetical protein
MNLGDVHCINIRTDVNVLGKYFFKSEAQSDIECSCQQRKKRFGLNARLHKLHTLAGK